MNRRRFIHSLVAAGATLLLPVTLAEQLEEDRRVYALDQTMLLRRAINPPRYEFVHVYDGPIGFAPGYRYTLTWEGREMRSGVKA